MSKRFYSAMRPFIGMLLVASCQSGDSSGISGDDDGEAPDLETISDDDSDTGTPGQDGDTQPSTPEPNMELGDLGLGIEIDINGATEVATLENQALGEVSGVTASKRYKNLMWMLNDSGSGPVIFAVTSDGRSIGQWPVGAPAYDWEDIASVVIGGVSYLLVADIGDNSRGRTYYHVHVLREPDAKNSIDNNPVLEPVASLNVQYPDRSHDSESLATDGSSVYILTKRDPGDGEPTNELFKFPLTLFDADVVAEHVGTVPERSVPVDPETGDAIAPRTIGQPTAMEISPFHQTAYILDYEKVFKIHRGDNQSWDEVLVTGGKFLFEHSLSQAEALTIAEDGSVWFTSENRPTPLWALPADF